MQPRRHSRFFILLLLIAIVAGVVGLSYVYQPAPEQKTVVVEVDLSELSQHKNRRQPAEYP